MGQGSELAQGQLIKERGKSAATSCRYTEALHMKPILQALRPCMSGVRVLWIEAGDGPRRDEGANRKLVVVSMSGDPYGF